MAELTLEQIACLFDELKLPRALAARGSPIDIVCPNEALHTRQDGRTTCRLWFDVCPHLFCFHAHCREANQELNTWLRLKVLGTTEFPENFEESLPETSRRKCVPEYTYARKVGRERARLLKRFEKVAARTPLEPIEITAVDFLRRLRVFKPDDLIWIGHLKSTGHPVYAANFRTLAQWETSSPPPGWSYTAGGAFLPGSFRRTRANVKAMRSLVLESDWLSVANTFAMARWVEDEFSLPLLAAVSSGNRSLHCYFKCPAGGPDWVDANGCALEEAGFDPKTFYPHQPVRLAGQTRLGLTSPMQHLLWARWLQPVKLKPRARKSQSQATP